MKLKKIFATAVAGLSLFAFAGQAAADFPADVNMWGASAQVIMWKNNGAAYMTAQGCTGIQMGETYTSGLPDNKHVIFKGTCGGVDRYFRISSKASYDAIAALQGSTYYGESATCSNLYQRRMLNPASCDFGTGVCTAPTASDCYTVTVGAMDTRHTCFKQISTGNTNGPAGGSTLTRNFILHPLSWTGAEPCKPLIVPFAFFVNKDVKKSGATISNITRDHAEIIFSGQAYDWSDLVDADGVAFDAKAMRKCLRHAGSGTHSSLDAYLVSGLIQAQDGGNQVWHTDSSSTMMPCINHATGSAYAAIGYADADQDLSLYANTVRVSLNGVPANPLSNTQMQAAIAGGNYNFYGLQHLYNAPASLCTFAGGGTVSAPWVLESDMIYKRTDTCESFPLEYK